MIRYGTANLGDNVNVDQAIVTGFVVYMLVFCTYRMSVILQLIER